MDRNRALEEAHWLVEKELCAKTKIDEYQAELFQNLENEFVASKGDEKKFIAEALCLGSSITQVLTSFTDFCEKAKPWARERYGANYPHMMSLLSILYVAEHGWAWHAHDGTETEKAILWGKILDCLVANIPTT